MVLSKLEAEIFEKLKGMCDLYGRLPCEITLSEKLGISEKLCCRVLRSLERKKYAEFQPGIWEIHYWERT